MITNRLTLLKRKEEDTVIEMGKGDMWLRAHVTGWPLEASDGVSQGRQQPLERLSPSAGREWCLGFHVARA